MGGESLGVRDLRDLHLLSHIRKLYILQRQGLTKRPLEIQLHLGNILL